MDIRKIKKLIELEEEIGLLMGGSSLEYNEKIDRKSVV